MDVLSSLPKPSPALGIEFYENNFKDRTYTKQTRPEVLANFILDKLK